MKHIHKVLLAGVTIGALTMAGTSAANAAEAAPATSNDSSITQKNFNDRDVIEFLAFGMGEINDSNPGLITALGYDGLAAEDPPAELIDDILAGVTEVNPEFNTQVTQRLQSGDPVAVETALTVYNDSMLEYVNTSDDWETESTEDGSGKALCLVWPLAVAVALVVAVVSTRTVAYVGPSTPQAALGSDDRLTRQEAAAEIATTINN